MKIIIGPVLCLMSLFAQEDPATLPARSQARSMTATTYGIVATSQTLASAAGAKVLESGGNAIDAAIAANAVLGLVEPTGNGIGGDLFAIVYEAKTGSLHGLNASGWAPSGLTPALLKSKGETKMPEMGIHSVTVPGAVAGWDALHRKFGKLPWATLFRPAIHYATEGFPVTELIGMGWEASILKKLSDAPHFLVKGKAPQQGEMFRNPDLAASLNAIALQGKSAFYEGAIAKALLAASTKLGGTFTAADLAEYVAEWVEPISTTYRGWTIAELPPNGQGLAALSMLNIMERFPLAEFGPLSAKSLHVMIEAKKLAYSDLLRYVGDPRFSKVPVQALISKELAGERAKQIDPERAAPAVIPSELTLLSRLPGADTIYLSVVDREGNMVSLIQSNYQGFGSGVVPPGAGFMLQNRGALFTLEPDQPNTLTPRKRPLHTIIPGFMSKGDTRIAFGIMGGWNQAQAHAQFVSDIVDFGMNIQAALEAPRFYHPKFEGQNVYLEGRTPAGVIPELTAKGHAVTTLGAYSGAVGGGQAVLRNSAGVNFGASDPRKDGAAIPQSPNFR
ncbi:MAG: gamma-glutamyltransferase [Bryobacteraceae bacterium]